MLTDCKAWSIHAGDLFLDSDILPFYGQKATSLCLPFAVHGLYTLGDIFQSIGTFLANDLFCPVIP